jgi:hypothetical protein
MSAFAPGNPPFDKLTYQERVDAGKEFIDLVRDHMTVGWSFTLCEGEFDAYMSGAALFGSAYSWACLMSLTGVHQWIEETGFDGKIAYFFEAGHKYQKQANWVMNQIYSGAYMRKKFRYAAHSFVDKQIVRPIQSADMLAWHQAKWIKDKYILGRETLRKDFKYLTERDTFTNHHSSKNYIAFHKHVLNPSPDQVEEILRDLLEQ